MIKTKKGLALIAAIMLITFVSIAVLGVTTFIVQWFAQLNADQLSSKCLYLAQAGIQDAIYKVRSTYNPPATNGSFTLGLNTVDPGETYRRGGTAADLLMVDTSAGAPSGQDFTGLHIQNVTSSVSPAVTIDRMVVTWVKGGTARTLQSIRFNGSNVWTGNLSSPANADLIPNYTLNTANTVNINRLRFNNNLNLLSSMTIQFVMTDGSTKTVNVFPAFNNCVFTIKSTGKVSGSSIYRTLEADYNLMPLTYATTSRLDDYDEINTEITSP
jgi:hypothetical protein